MNSAWTGLETTSPIVILVVVAVSSRARSPRPLATVPSARVELLGEPGLDQGLIGNVALVGGHLDRSSRLTGRRREIDVVEGLRFGNRTRSARPQSMQSVESWLSQKLRSSASLSKVGTGSGLLRIARPLLAAHVAGERPWRPEVEVAPVDRCRYRSKMCERGRPLTTCISRLS